MKYNQDLPKEVEQKLDAYIERIKKINWFNPSPDLKEEDVKKQVNVILKAFGVEASFKYRQLKTEKDWDAARDAAWDAAWGAARDAARDAAWDAARGAARDAAKGAARDAAWDAAWGAAWDASRDASSGAAWDAAWGAACDAAWDAAWGAENILAEDLNEFQKKYPNGTFINIIPLWEMGLYPIGVVDGKFIVYKPV